MSSIHDFISRRDRYAAYCRITDKNECSSFLYWLVSNCSTMDCLCEFEYDELLIFELYDNDTLVHFLAYGDDDILMKYALMHGVEWNTVGNNEMTPLEIAIYWQNYKCVELIGQKMRQEL